MNYQSIIKNLLIVAVLFVFTIDSNAQHLFYINYDDVSHEDVQKLRSQISKSDISTLSLSKNNENNDVYQFQISSAQNSKIIVLNEETGKNAVIIPVEESISHFQLAPFFIEELKQSVLGDASRYLICETDDNFLMRNAVSISTITDDVFIPRYFYGKKENVREALPKERQIIHIFKEKPRLIHVFKDPEGLNYIAQLEEEMSYYVYMYKLPDGTLCIYDEHFNPKKDENEIKTRSSLPFNLTGNLTGMALSSTLYACGLWGDVLGGTIPIDISVDLIPLGAGILGQSWRQPNYFNTSNETWYCSALGNQLAGYNVTPAMRDIRLEMSSNYTWYYDPNGDPGSLYDWITVMLHEITHGLGFYMLVGSSGAYSYTTQTGGSSPTNYPSIYDRFLYEGLTGTAMTELTQSQRASLVVSNNLYAGSPGSQLLSANGGVRVKMYAPSSWSGGSSVSHWDTSVTFETFMKYAYQYKLHTIGTRKIAIMMDMGWSPPIPSVPYTINITTDTGDSPAGAVITLTHRTNSEYVYTKVAESGTVNFPRVVNGRYNISIKKTSFNPYLASNILINDNYPSHNAHLTKCAAPFPFSEGFENNAANLPGCWGQEFVVNETPWRIVPANTGTPNNASEGSYKAYICGVQAHIGHKTKLVSAPFNIENAENPTLTFMHAQRHYAGDQDKLRIFYKTSLNGNWIFLTEYTTNTNDWTKRTIALPNGTNDYYIAFEAQLGWGHGVHLDEIKVFDNIPYPPANVVAQIVDNKVEITWDNAGIPGLDFESYLLFRYAEAQDELLLLSDVITEPFFTDEEWLTLPQGSYQYAVMCKYINNVISAPEFSNTLIKNYFTVTVSANPQNGGTVSGGGIFSEGIETTVTATSETNYYFVNWTVNDKEVSDDFSYTFTVTEDIELVANFALEQYLITYSDPENGAMAATSGCNYIPSGTKVDFGTVLRIFVTPDVNYHVETITANGEEIENGGNYKVVSDTNIECTIVEDDKYTLTLEVYPEGTGNVNGGGEYFEWEYAFLSATPNSNYRFVNWSDGETQLSVNQSYTYTMPAEDKKLTANFALKQYFVTYETPENGILSVLTTDEIPISNGDEVEHGTNLIITAIPNNGYSFETLKVNGIDFENGTVYSVISDTYIECTFNNVNINSQKLSNIIVYSESSKIYIVNKSNINLKSVQIVDFLGRIIYSGETETSSIIEINATAGHYIVKLITAEGLIFNSKVSLTK